MGISKASALSDQVIMLETVIRFYGYLHDRLKYMQPSVKSLIEQAANSQEFTELKFLAYCYEKMQEGIDFSESWNSAIYDQSVFSDNITKIIQNISNTLGTSDLESQLAAISYDRSKLEQRLIEAREYAEKHKKLYQTMGVLSGLGLAVFIA